jgi:lipopolysaccharide transport system permease protein
MPVRWHAVVKILSLRRNVLAVLEVLRVAHKRRELVWGLVRRDLFERYAAQSLSIIWALIQPLTIVFVYILFFNVLLNLGGSLRARGLPSYSQYVVAGLLPWLMAQAAIGRAPMALISQRAIVRQLAFPVELLTLIPTIGTGIIIGIVTLMTVIYFATTGDVGFACLLVAFPFMFILIFLIGMTMIISTITIFVRDMQEIVSLFLVVGVYLTPIAIPFDSAPMPYRIIMLMNPISYFVLCYQDALYFNSIKHLFAWIAMPVLSLMMLGIGARFFVIMRPHSVSQL